MKYCRETTWGLDKSLQKSVGKEASLPDGYTPPSVHISWPLDINTNRISLSELKPVIKQLISSKAFGPYNIPALNLKDLHFNTLLLNISSHTFSAHSPLNIWHKPQSIPMPERVTFHGYKRFSDISSCSIVSLLLWGLDFAKTPRDSDTVDPPVSKFSACAGLLRIQT